MSKVEQWMWVSPHMYIRDDRTEVRESIGHTCTVCNGKGYCNVMGDDGEDDNVPCSVCEGSGKLDAKITIEWLPSRNV